jgi:WD40 repeat protein
MRALVAVFAVAALVAGSLTIVARNRGALAERQAREARARELATASLANIQADPERAILLAIEAVRTTRAADGSVARQAEDALHQAVEASRVVLRLDVHPVELVYSRDGSRLATTGTSGSVSAGDPVLEPQEKEAIVWDAATGQRLLTLKDHRSRVWDVEFSPDGSRIATSDERGIVGIWDGATGERLVTLHAGTGGTLPQVDFSPDGTTLLATDGYTDGKGRGTIWLWDVRTGHLVRRWSTSGAICGIAFSPDGGLVAGGLCSPPGGETFVWDARTGERILTLQGHTDLILDLAWSPDGRRIATAGVDGEAKVWDVRTGAELLTLTGHTSFVTGVAFAPDGRLVATASYDGTVRLWNADTGEQVLELSGHGGANSDVVFSPDGQRVASGGADATLVWDITPPGSREQATIASSGATQSVVYSPDGSRLATMSSSGQARLWDPSSGRKLLTFSGQEASMSSAFGPDGSMLVTGAIGSPVVWDTASGKVRHVLDTRGTISGVAVSPDGGLIATANCDQTSRGVTVWDATSGERVRALTTPQTHDLDFSPDGTLLAAGRCDGTVTFWKVPSFEVLRRISGNGSALDAVDFSPDGTRLATSNVDGTASVWTLPLATWPFPGRPRGEVSDVTSARTEAPGDRGADSTARLSGRLDRPRAAHADRVDPGNDLRGVQPGRNPARGLGQGRNGASTCFRRAARRSGEGAPDAELDVGGVPTVPASAELSERVAGR